MSVRVCVAAASAVQVAAATPAASVAVTGPVVVMTSVTSGSGLSQKELGRDRRTTPRSRTENAAIASTSGSRFRLAAD